VRDWQALVRERLSGRGLTTAQKEEVVAELSSHLEELYEEAISQEADESDAVRRALDEVANWRQLSRRIQSSKQKEGQMNYRTRSLWLPGFASLTAAMGTLMLMNRFGIEPIILWHGSLAIFQIHLPWLAVLPLFGALGAYLSQRANGNLKLRLAAASFPALVLLGLFCPGIVIAAIFQSHRTWHDLPVAFAVVVFNWVLIPGAALLVGALPFLRNSQIRDAEQAG
jgi:hypothetical protein